MLIHNLILGTYSLMFGEYLQTNTRVAIKLETKVGTVDSAL